MYYMLSCFNLKPDVSIDSFSIALDEFASYLQELKQIESVGPVYERDKNTKMDTDERDHQYYFVTKFIDKAQCDQSYQFILENEGVKNLRHSEVLRKVSDPVFICYGEEGGIG